MRLSLLIVAAIVAAGCGSNKKESPGQGPPMAEDAAAAAAPVIDVVVGVEQPKVFNFRYGKGSKPFAAAEKAVKTNDWQAAADGARAAIEADPEHFDAHFLLARALIELGTPEAAREHLEVALSADFLEYAPQLSGKNSLVEFLASVAGAEANAVVAKIRQTFLDRAKSGLFLVARRTPFRSPAPKKKLQWAATRAELFSYDRETARYLRLTHTKESVAAWLPSPSGEELAFVAYSSVKTPASEADPTLLGYVKIGVIDLDTLQVHGHQLASVKGTPRRVSLGYRAGDELVVVTGEADGRWGTKAEKTFVFDRGQVKLKPSKVALDATEILHVDYDRVRLERAASPEIQAEAEATTFRLLPTNTTVAMPTGEAVGAGGYTWAPDKVHLVVRTIARPCEDQRERTLYLIDAATGNQKNILRGVASFETRWIDNDHFVYEDDEGMLRIYDVEERTQVARLEERGGLALVGVAVGRGPVCTERLADDAATEAIEPGDGDLEGEGIE
ncbi:MAG TPA: tetratricopeptide repeat protein [Kofleriaceae bacterium]|nr:tetratricopeptide repeat protein [Kofleriaceae bacterium]